PKPAPAPTPESKTAIYTCPMHPEIRQQGPGACPICGMALEPAEVSATVEPNHELIDMKRRLSAGIALGIPVVALDMGEHFTALGNITHAGPADWVQLAFATPVVLWSGWPFFQRGWASLVSRHLNMFTLIALGTGAAWAYSVVATVAPSLFPAVYR